MKTLLQPAAVLALVVFSAGTVVVVWDAHRIVGNANGLLTRANTSLAHVDVVLTQAQVEWQNEKTAIRSIVSSSQAAAQQTADFAREQRAQLAKTSRDSDNQVRALGLVTRNAETFFYNLDEQLNRHVLPDFDRELVATSTGAQLSFESFAHAADALTFQINDPAIPQTLDNVNRAAGSLAVASANGASILGHADHVVAYYDKKLTTPLGFWKTLLKSGLNVGSQAGNIWAGFGK